mmetsp:Transcript_15572/g.39605  ORF Transcript_15572/g.39605 Transcript_15572/m.39605 type:complete len:199 (-) Transcript_15572:1230-1826(-)
MVRDSRTCKYFLSRMVQAKVDMAEKPIKVVRTLETLEQHAEQVHASLYYLVLESCKVTQPEALDAAGHMGKGVGLATLLRDVSEDARKDKVYLPTDLCRKHKLNYGQVQQGYNSDELSEVIFQVAARAKGHLDEAKRRHGALPSALKPFLLPCVPALDYLERLERVNFAPFTNDLQDTALTDLRLKMTLAWRNFAGSL